MTEFDSPWKEALDRFLRLFLEFFFPHIAAETNWEHGYEVLDKELEQIVREGEMGKRLADKLFKVWRKDGQETWLLIHLEIQAQAEAEFPERMYVYNYRIYDRYRHPVVSLAVLGDDRPNWRPSEFGYNVWGCEVMLRFPVVKLLDYGSDLGALEASPNPFGLIVLAHLQSLATRDKPTDRCAWKIRLIKSLLDRGLNAEEIRQLFRLIDWMMDLPRELTREFKQKIAEYEMEKKMQYVTSVERMAKEEGREEGRREGLLEGIAAGLQQKYGEAGAQLLPRVRALTDLERLRTIQQALWSGLSLDQVRQLLSGQLQENG